MVSESIKVPDGYTEQHAEYLDDLRESGVTNMFGAGEFLVDAFGLTQGLAGDYLVYWMETFKQRMEDKKNDGQ
jgi:hypothetical protein|tara:strand:- start:8281 stop:8499 length:219 start_codon:yes stop_codon:yes gene_type:complete